MVRQTVCPIPTYLTESVSPCGGVEKDDPIAHSTLWHTVVGPLDGFDHLRTVMVTGLEALQHVGLRQVLPCLQRVFLLGHLVPPGQIEFFGFRDDFAFVPCGTIPNVMQAMKSVRVGGRGVGVLAARCMSKSVMVWEYLKGVLLLW